MEGSSGTPELYHPDILAYARNPGRWRKDHDAQYVISAYNPVCGDKFEIRLDMDDVITDASFFGYGCVVSKASTALLTEMLVNKQLEEAHELLVRYIRVMTEEKDTLQLDISFRPFLNAKAYPGRLQCALLAWESLLRHPLFQSNKTRFS